MSLPRQLFFVLVVIGLIFLLPYLGSLIHNAGVFPPDFFAYPPLTAPTKPGFNLWIFIAMAVVCFIFVLIYIFPRLFGFRNVVAAPAPAPTGTPRLPLWFWLGLIMWGGTLFVMWMHYSSPLWLINWADIPLFWGFALVMDGIVFYRTRGKSIIGQFPTEILGIGMASISGWLLFEFLNFFVNDNWLYPFGYLLPDNEFVIYAVIGSSGLLPLAFEWYSLLATFKKFWIRYTDGPRIISSRIVKWILLIVCLIALFITGLMPDDMFFVLWLAPLVILGIALELLGIWTPFTAIRSGNWAPTLLFALSYFIQGTLLECWNYFSGTHAGGVLNTHNPAYWAYSIGYVDVLHVFEMPLLGLFGYLPFGIYCLIWWIVFAFLLKIETNFPKLNP